jgi:hypothetical protein
MALNRRLVAKFAAATNLDPLDISKAYERREELFLERAEAKDCWQTLAAASATFGVVITGLGFLFGGPIVGAPLLLLSVAGFGVGLENAATVNRKVAGDVQKFLPPPQTPPALPAPEPKLS